jgi:hypothetical protein
MSSSFVSFSGPTKNERMRGLLTQTQGKTAPSNAPIFSCPSYLHTIAQCKVGVVLHWQAMWSGMGWVGGGRSTSSGQSKKPPPRVVMIQTRQCMERTSRLVLVATVFLRSKTLLTPSSFTDSCSVTSPERDKRDKRRGSEGARQARQDKARHDKDQTRSRPDKTRQDQDQTRQDKTRQDKTRQDKTRQDKTRQDKTRQDR